MGYIEQNLVAGEKVIYKTRLHWIVVVRPVLFGLVLAAAGVALLIWDYETHFALGGIAIISGLVRRNATEVAVSNMRVLIKSGMLERKSIEVLLAKVESIGVDETAFGRMLGYGSVIIRGTGGTFETFHNIARPNEFRRAVQQQIGPAAPPSARPNPASV